MRLLADLRSERRASKRPELQKIELTAPGDAPLAVEKRTTIAGATSMSTAIEPSTIAISR